jgi:hypothetical protein
MSSWPNLQACWNDGAVPIHMVLLAVLYPRNPREDPGSL